MQATDSTRVASVVQPSQANVSLLLELLQPTTSLCLSATIRHFVDENG